MYTEGVEKRLQALGWWCPPPRLYPFKRTQGERTRAMYTNKDIPSHVRQQVAYHNASVAKRYGQYRPIGYSVSATGIYRKMELQDWQCQYCDRTIAFSSCELDHVIPLVKEIYHTLANIVLSCRECNRKKKWHNLKRWCERTGRDYLELRCKIDDVNIQLEIEGYEMHGFENATFPMVSEEKKQPIVEKDEIAPDAPLVQLRLPLFD